jgi:hypothetical protein
MCATGSKWHKKPTEPEIVSLLALTPTYAKVKKKRYVIVNVMNLSDVFL